MPIVLSTARQPCLGAFATAILMCAGVTSCGTLEDPPSLEVVGTAPVNASSWPADLPIEVRFDRYLDPDTVDESDAVVTSGELEATVDVGYDPVARALTVDPIYNLRVGVAYELRVRADGVRGLDGSALTEDVVVRFTAGPVSGAEPTYRVTFADVEPVFAARCGCHGPAPAAFPALTPAELVHQPAARQPARTLVVPGAPLDSYLVQRILVDYPGVSGGEKALDDDARRQIVRWVEGLVR